MKNRNPDILHYFYHGIFIISIVFNISCDKPSAIPVKKDLEHIKTPEVFESWVNTDYIMGKFEPKDHTDFVEIDIRYADRAGLMMRKEAYEAFMSMWSEAKNENLTLVIKSATRNFDYQKGIWERKWNGNTTLSDGTKASDIEDYTARASKILLYSSMPGTSRHHWGTDIDLNNFNNEYFAAGKGLEIYNWLLNNAPRFGFCQPYSSKINGRTGYEEEKWHWSYMPLSASLTRFSSTKVKNEMIIGFDGHEASVPLNVVQNYILGINPHCL